MASHHLLVCLTTGPQPHPKLVLHKVRSSASSFNLQYPSNVTQQLLTSSSSSSRHFYPSLYLSFNSVFYNTVHLQCGQGSSVGIATELRAGRSGIESRWGRDFPPLQTGPGAHPASCTMGTGSILGLKCDRGVLLTTHPFQCRGHERLELYL